MLKISRRKLTVIGASFYARDQAPCLWHPSPAPMRGLQPLPWRSFSIRRFRTRMALRGMGGRYHLCCFVPGRCVRRALAGLGADAAQVCPLPGLPGRRGWGCVFRIGCRLRRSALHPPAWRGRLGLVPVGSGGVHGAQVARPGFGVHGVVVGQVLLRGDEGDDEVAYQLRGRLRRLGLWLWGGIARRLCLM